jgi:hypothetical protein
LLDAELKEASPNRAEIRLLFRYFSVAVGGAVGSHIRLEEDLAAIELIEDVMPRLRKVARLIFQETVGRDPARLLLPPVASGGITLECLVDLFRQARRAGAVSSPEDYTVSTWFEEHRDKLFAASAPYFGSWESYAAQYRREVLEAASVIEEVNRVKGLGTMLLEVGAAGHGAAEVGRKVDEAIRAQASPGHHVVWGLA